MAKRKKSYSATKCPEPLNTMIDLAGALAMGAFAKHQIKKDFRRGQGAESVKAATMVYGMGAMRRGSEGLISLGGLYGVNSAIRDIEKGEVITADHIRSIRPGYGIAPKYIEMLLGKRAGMSLKRGNPVTKEFLEAAQ